ncbi:DinB family protein [Oryzifoliimicrobium ureilyticus]|uniref:DinB family protein n=1 Tax=Oryzifoliimicrobium ureilyticus TaxID=3113724 RepID=UPI0030760A55
MTAFDPCRSFRKLAYNNRLANHRLHEACSKLLPGEFEATRISFFPSIKATLNHIVTVDWFYVDALEGGTLGPKAWAQEEPFDAIADLTKAQADVDCRLIALCEDLDISRLSSIMPLQRTGRIQTERVEDVLSHLFQHQTHHRGQVHAMLSGTSVPPPQLDEFITADDARHRQGDVAALGWNEFKLMH